MKKIKYLLLLLSVLFIGLLGARLGYWDLIRSQSMNVLSVEKARVSEKDSWMNVFQSSRKIGYSHTKLTKKDVGYFLEDEIFMRINIMGLAQDLKLKVKANLSEDLAFSDFNFTAASGIFTFAAKGRVQGKKIVVNTESSGKSGHLTIPFTKNPFPEAGIIKAVMNSKPKDGAQYKFSLFDPAGLTQETVIVKVMGREKIVIGDEKIKSLKLGMGFKGMTQNIWVDEKGDMLKASGLLGISFVKTTMQDAMFGMPVSASDDITKLASVRSNIKIDDPGALREMKVRIMGVMNLADLELNQGRQTLEGNLLIIKKEDISAIEAGGGGLLQGADKFLKYIKPSPFIESDHPDIKNLVEKITGIEDKPIERVRKIMKWIGKNIEKKPVLSVPDALATLKNRVGDCNEHAVLFAALARAAGIPARVEAGVVYLKGRFYYHAWNLIYLGQWVTADSVFNQMPADVTHICFSTGMKNITSDIMSVIDKLEIKVEAIND